MKRLITLAASALVIAVGGTMLATPAHAAATKDCGWAEYFAIMDEIDQVCGGGNWYGVLYCDADGNAAGTIWCE